MSDEHIEIAEVCEAIECWAARSQSWGCEISREPELDRKKMDRLMDGCRYYRPGRMVIMTVTFHDVDTKKNGK